MSKLNITFVASVGERFSGAQISFIKILLEVLKMFESDPSIKAIITIPSRNLPERQMNFVRELVKIGRGRVKVILLPPAYDKYEIPKRIRTIIRNLLYNYLKTESKILFINSEDIHQYFPLVNFPFCRKKVIFWMHATPFLCAPPYVFKEGNRAVLRYLLEEGFWKMLEYFFYNFCLILLHGRDIVASPGLISALKGTGFFRFFRFSAFPHYPIQYDFSYSVEKTFDAVYLASFIRGKGLKDCLKIWLLVIGEMPTAKLIVIGPPKELVTRLAEELGISNNIVALGAIYDEKTKRTLLKKSKLLIYPSVFDSYPNVIAESLSLGLPVLCYDITPFKENFNLEPVIKVEAKNYPRAASLIKKVLEDDHRREALSKEALRFSEETYSAANVTERFIKILRGLAN